MLGIILLSLSLVTTTLACTTLAVGKKATRDGSVMAAHSADGNGVTDPRLVRIPGNSYAPNSRRAVFASPELYPRYVGDDPRSPSGEVPAYLPENCQAGETNCDVWEPIGYIPQVEQTFSYMEAVYGVMNEHQVGIAESTCSAVFSARPVHQGGRALLSINALSQIAMERATTSREAVSIMGALAEEFGFYGASDSFEGGAESLMVTDPSEAWSFHILAGPDVAYDSKLGDKAEFKSGAVWVAARVCDECVTVTANMFSIREVNLNDPANFLGTSNMWQIAEEHGFWRPGEPMDFTATFSDGEYAHKYYSGRRMWGVYRLLAPEAGLSPDYGNLKEDRPYPFQAPVSGPVKDKTGGVAPEDIFAVMRDYYNETRFSLGAPSTGGGPWGSVDRMGYNDPNSKIQVSGNWERSIGLWRTAESYIVQSGGSVAGPVKAANATIPGGVVHFGAQSALYTVYVPIFGGGTIELPAPLVSGWQGVYDLTTNFWAARTVAFTAQVKWSYIIQDVQAMQRRLEAESQKLIASLFSGTSADIVSTMAKNSQKAVEESLALFHTSLFKYADGYINQWRGDKFTSSTINYPGYWLRTTDYKWGPPPVQEE
jgi:dipeptidase